MNYELAKQLKDAGFPQDGEGENIFNETWDEPNTEKYHERPSAYLPSLSELIEVCGVSFESLTKTSFSACQDNSLVLSVEEPNVAYLATSIAEEVKGWGLTPEEAVAKLWLELHSDNGLKVEEEPASPR